MKFDSFEKNYKVMHIGEKVRLIRNFKGIKQEDIAKELGMSQQNYSKLESGITKMTDDKLTIIANKFGMTPEELQNTIPSITFNNCTYENNHTVSGDFYNEFPEELKKLYEDKIALLEENKSHLKFENDLLRAENSKLKAK